MELEFDLTRVRDLTLAGDLWCRHHEAGNRDVALPCTSVMPPSEVAVD
jgi:hypothetical protein